MYRYIWRIKLDNPANELAFINHWRSGSAILQEYEGALGTHLHKVRGAAGAFFAVAEWASQAARDAMNDDINRGESDRSKRWRRLPPNESFGTVVGFAGEELAVVLPESPAV